MLQDLGVTLLVELPLDDDEGLSVACEPSGLHLVSREHLAGIGHAPVGQRVGPRCWFHVKLLDLKVGKGWPVPAPRSGSRACIDR
jgi:hypothetical protein